MRCEVCGTDQGIKTKQVIQGKANHTNSVFRHTCTCGHEWSSYSKANEQALDLIERIKQEEALNKIKKDKINNYD